MNRRGTVLALVALSAAPLTVQAQPTARVYRVGFVSPTSPGSTFHAFWDGLRELGYVEGKNVIVEARFSEGRSERLPEMIAEALRLRIDVLVVGGSLGALAAKRATKTVPIVFAGVVDPVALGIVASLARPGGNITGATMGIGLADFGGKWVELLKAAIPDVSHVAVLWNSASPSSAPLLPGIQTAARTLNVKLDLLDAGNPTKLDRAFAAISASGARGIIVTYDPFFYVYRGRLVQFAARKRLPAVYYSSVFADAGGLMAYGSSPEDSYRRAATYVDKILKGAKPTDLPVEQPTKFELVINLKTAKVLGLKIPQTLLQRVDRVIE